MTINKQEWSAFNCYRLRLCQPRTHTIRFVPHAGKANQTETKIRQKLPLSERERKRAAAKVKEKRGKKCLDKSLEINQIKISENEKRQINGSEMHKPYRFFFSLSSLVVVSSSSSREKKTHSASDKYLMLKHEKYICHGESKYHYYPPFMLRSSTRRTSAASMAALRCCPKANLHNRFSNIFVSMKQQSPVWTCDDTIFIFVFGIARIARALFRDDKF